jgi:hypothetical protein
MVAAMKHLILHVGAPKTGSSLVQKALHANQERLAGRGYRTFIRHEFDDVTDHAHARWRRGRRNRTELLVTSFESLRDAVDGAENAIVSHEDMLGPIGSFRLGRLYQDAEVVLRTAVDVLKPEQVSVVLYVRRQDRFAESVYLQMVRQGYAKPFDEFYAPVTPDALRWDDLADRIQASLPDGSEVLVNYFEDISELGGRGFCRNFVHQLVPGMRVELPFNTGAVNRGYSDLALRIALAANAQIERDDRRKLRAFLDENFSNVTHPKPVLLTGEQRAELLTALVEPNTRLHARVVGDGTPGPYATAAG